MLSEKLKQARIDKKLSQSELAEKLFISKQSISKYENGKAVPNDEILVKLEEILEVKLKYETTEIRKDRVKVLYGLILVLIIVVITLTVVIINQKNKLNDYEYLTRQVSTSVNGFQVSYLDDYVDNNSNRYWIKVSVYNESDEVQNFNVNTLTINKVDINRTGYSYDSPSVAGRGGIIQENVDVGETKVFWVCFEIEDINNIIDKEVTVTFNGEIVTVIEIEDK